MPPNGTDAPPQGGHRAAKAPRAEGTRIDAHRVRRGGPTTRPQAARSRRAKRQSANGRWSRARSVPAPRSVAGKRRGAATLDKRTGAIYTGGK